MKIIGGLHRGKALKAPKGESTRPSSARLRESLFNICQFVIENACFLDLFAGSGAIGLEALSRGAGHVIFVENNPLALAALRQNIQLLKEEKRCTVLSLEVFVALEHLRKRNTTFDIVFADPPYSQSIHDEVLLFFDREVLLKKEGFLFLEERFSAKREIELVTLFLASERKIGEAKLLQFKKG